MCTVYVHVYIFRHTVYLCVYVCVYVCVHVCVHVFTYLQFHTVLLGGLHSQTVVCLIKRHKDIGRCSLSGFVSRALCCLFVQLLEKSPLSYPSGENKEQTHKDSPASAFWQQQSLTTHVRDDMAWNGRCSMDGKSGSQLFSPFFRSLEVKGQRQSCRSVTIN